MVVLFSEILLIDVRVNYSYRDNISYSIYKYNI